MGLADQILLPDWSEGGKESWKVEMNRVGHRNDYVEYKYLLLRTLLAAGFISSIRMIITSQAQEKQGFGGRKYSERLREVQGPEFITMQHPPAYQSYPYYFPSSLYSMGACFASLDPESES